MWIVTSLVKISPEGNWWKISIEEGVDCDIPDAEPAKNSAVVPPVISLPSKSK